MKKLFWITLLLVFIYTPYSQAQQDPKAKTILDAVNQKYKSMKAFRAYFVYNMLSPNSGVNESFEGNIVVKGSKFYLELPEQHVITDSKTQWTFMKDGNEVNISDYAPDEDEITPDKIYGIYEKNYDYAYMEEVNENGRAYHIIDLTPKNKDSHSFFKIRLKIVKSSNSLKSWEIFEKNANKYTYNINKFEEVKVPDNYFKYYKSKYPSNPELVDLR
jgi:outer membrane lipoprotein-sorting protein